MLNASETNSNFQFDGNELEQRALVHEEEGYDKPEGHDSAPSVIHILISTFSYLIFVSSLEEKIECSFHGAILIFQCL